MSALASLEIGMPGTHRSQIENSSGRHAGGPAMRPKRPVKTRDENAVKKHEWNIFFTFCAPKNACERPVKNRVENGVKKQEWKTVCPIEC